MSVTAKATKLAEAIKETDQFKDLKSAEGRIKLDPNAQDLVEELQTKQQALMQAQQAGENPSASVIKELEQLQAQVKLNTTLQGFFKAQENFSDLMQEVNQVITENLQK